MYGGNGIRPNCSMRSRTVTWSPPLSKRTRDGLYCNREISPPIPEGTRKGMPLLYDGNGLRDSCIVGARFTPARVSWLLVDNDLFSTVNRTILPPASVLASTSACKYTPCCISWSLAVSFPNTILDPSRNRRPGRTNVSQ